MEYSQTPVIVVARNFSTALGVVRSLGEKGHSVYFVGGAYKKGALVYASVSKYIDKFTETVSPDADEAHEKDLLKAILSYKDSLPKNTVIFPTDDFTAETVEKNRNVLSKHYLLPHTQEGSEYSLLELTDKSVQHSIAERSGLKTAAEWKINLDSSDIPEEIIYPCICKPVKSVAGHKDEIKVCGSENELREHLSYLSSSLGRTGSVLVQQYLSVDYEIDMSAVCIDRKVILPGVIFKHRISEKQSGVTMAGELCKNEIAGDEIEKVKAFLSSLRLTGIIDLELMVCGDEIYFNELNLRSGGPVYAYTAGGVNLPHIFVNALSSKDYSDEEEKVLDFGKRFLYEKVAWEDYFGGFLPYASLKKLEKNADIRLLKNEKDRLPYVLFSARKTLQNTVRRIRSPKKELLLLGERAYAFYMSHRLKNPIKANDYPAVVVGNNYNVNYAVARSLGEEGCRVSVIQLFDTNLIHTVFRHFILPQPSAFSRYIQDYSVCILGKDNEEAKKKLISYLSAYGNVNNPPCLIATDDKAVEMLDGYFKMLSCSFLVPNAGGKNGGFVELMDKTVQSSLAKKAGLNVPEEWIVDVSQNIETKNFIYPCICKPLISAEGAKAEIKICGDEKALTSHLENLCDKGTKKVLIQQFITSDYEIDMSGVCFDDKVLLSGIIKKTSVSKASVGVTTSGVMLSPDLPDGETEKIKAFLKSLNIRGIFDLECLVSGDKVYFIEINFRTGAPIYSYPATGVNVPKIFLDSLKNNTPAFSGREVSREGASVVSERSLLEEFRNGNMSFKEARSIIKSSDICFIKDRNDKRPYRKFLLFFITNRFLRKMKKK